MKTVHPGLRAALEFGPIVAYLAAYFLYGRETFLVGGTEYPGLIAVTAIFIPVFLAAIGTLWLLTGRIARIQVVVAVMLVIFGALGIWMNDPRLLKMKPTVIYLLLGLFLGIGLLRGQSWLKLIMAEVIPMRTRGWMILTKRVTLLFFLSALANEIVWRTQSEAFWVYFETIAMPIVVFVFFVTQIGLVVEHAKLKKPKKKARARRRGSDA